jgi:hypothetical protein
MVLKWHILCFYKKIDKHRSLKQIDNKKRRPQMKKCREYKKCGNEDCIVFKKYHNSSLVPHCWYVAGTMCGGRVQGEYAQKIGNCRNCDYFLYIRDITSLKKVSVA